MKRIAALLVCLCLLLTGCNREGDYTPTGDGLGEGAYTGGQNSGQNGENAPQFSLPYYADRSLNPYQCTDFTNRTLFSLLYQSLFVTNRNYETEPQLCSRFSMSEDMKSYTFYVENATFSDGTPVTGEDVAASLNAAKDGAFYKGRFLHITQIIANPDGGVTLHLDTAMENLPLLLDMPIVKASQVADEKPMGTGPYVWFTAAGGDSLRKRNNWWCSAKLALDAETIALFAANSVTHIRDQFEFRGLSMVCADPGSDRYADYRCDYELFDSENGNFLYLAVSKDSKVFQKDGLRIALTYAIDRDRLAKDFYRGFARSASLPASPACPWYNQKLAERYQYDGVRFVQEVKNAGAEGSSVVLLVNSDDSLRLRVAREIAQMLKDGGLQVELKTLGGNAYVEAIKARQYDLYLGQTRLSPNMDLSAFFATYGDLSWGGVNDMGAYALSLQALENHGNYFSLHKLVMDQGLLCPILFQSYSIFATRGLVSDLTPARDNLFYYSLGLTMEDAKQ